MNIPSVANSKMVARQLSGRGNDASTNCHCPTKISWPAPSVLARRAIPSDIGLSQRDALICILPERLGPPRCCQAWKSSSLGMGCIGQNGALEPLEIPKFTQLKSGRMLLHLFRLCLGTVARAVNLARRSAPLGPETLL